VSDLSPLANELERLADKHGISKLLFALVEVCHAKAEHLRSNWQDERNAKNWLTDAAALEKLAAKVRTT
jgi:hypothetical protein